MDNTDNYIGKFLDNRYEILEKIGSGGMAVVYKARCHRLNRLVAVKILKDELAQDSEFRRRFHAESQAIAMLSHPNIVQVYDVSRSGNVEYIVMELIEGITLKQYINRKGVLGWKEALHFSTQIAKALSHAHSRNIIHRDIKPHNIMILKDGSVKVADFGIAQLLNTQNTLTQEALGSVHYISPEQAKGGHVDKRSDLYSFGVVMYEMLTSRLPFEGDSAVSVAIQHISSVPLMPREINPDIPQGLEDITMHAMEPNLENRYKSADEMLHDLEEFRKNPDITFNYATTGKSAEVEGDDATKVIPVGGIVPAASAVTQKAARQKTKELSSKEHRKNKKKARKTSTLIGVFCVAVFLIILFVFMWKFLLKDMLNPTDERVTIPNFVSMYEDDVVNNAEYTKYYNFTVEYEASDKYDKGYIMEQNPAADRQMTVVESGIDVTLKVSSGAETVLMPNIVNSDYRQAEIQLQNLNLDLVIEKEAAYSDTVTSGYVIEQYPAAGTELKKGATVYITYSKGPEEVLVTVPNVVNYTVSQAITRLESYNLTYEVQYVDDSTPAGTVIFQSYQSGEQVAEGTKIVLQVSNGPTATPSPTVAPTETPTETPAASPSA